MSDEKAKEIIKAYEKGQVSLSEYVEAIEYVAMNHPKIDMIQLIDWVKK